MPDRGVSGFYGENMSITFPKRIVTSLFELHQEYIIRVTQVINFDGYSFT